MKKFVSLFPICSLFFTCFFLFLTLGCQQNADSVKMVTETTAETAPETEIKSDTTPETAPTPEETGFILDGSEEDMAGESDEDIPEFGEGEDWEVGNSDVNQEELDKYIGNSDYMFEPLKLDAPLFETETGTDTELVRLHPEKPIWVDRERKHVILQGWVSQTKVMLEFLLCQGAGGVRTFPYQDETGKPAKMLMFNGTKCHESVLTTEVPGRFIHTGLLAIGAEPGTPFQLKQKESTDGDDFEMEFIPPTGEEIEILIRWQTEDGKTVEHRAQDLIVDAEGKMCQVPWVFAGSLFYKDSENIERYAADSEGEFISVSNFPNTILDITQPSSSSNEQLMYVANEKILPERGTPVTIIMSCKSDAGNAEN